MMIHDTYYELFLETRKRGLELFFKPGLQKTKIKEHVPCTSTRDQPKKISDINGLEQTKNVCDSESFLDLLGSQILLGVTDENVFCITLSFITKT